MTECQTTAQKLTDEDVSNFLNAIGAAPRQMRHARQRLTEKYNLGPRGAWILGLVKSGVNSPSLLSDAFSIGRSLVTAELNRVVDAGLVNARKHDGDRRRVMLSLTAEGEAAARQLAIDVSEFVHERLAGYSKKEVQLCVRLLRDFALTDRRYFQPMDK
jgi:DNA-binding MarR family transcriptional regulator